MHIRLKRIYERPEKADGRRILVERLWPRGVTRQRAELCAWAREVAPTASLRKWYGHDPEKWPEFVSRYRQELAANTDEVAALRALCAGKAATFVYAAKDEGRNSAVVLKAFMEETA